MSRIRIIRNAPQGAQGKKKIVHCTDCTIRSVNFCAPLYRRGALRRRALRSAVTLSSSSLLLLLLLSLSGDI